MKNIFDPQRRKLAGKYNKEIKKHNWFYRIYNILFWSVLICYHLETKMYNFISSLINYKEIKIFTFILGFYIIYKIFPWLFDYFLGFRLDRKFNISNQTSVEWIIDKMKVISLNLLLLLSTGRLIIFLMALYPDYWWVIFSITATIFLITIQYLVPTVIIPLFFELTTYPENNLKERLEKLFKKAGLEIEDIYEINLSVKTNTANAAVAGLGKNRKILLADTLQDKYKDGEVEAIMAHEIGHTVNKDQFKSIIYQPLIILIISYIISLIWPFFTAWRGYAVLNSTAALPFLLLLYRIINYIFLPPYLLLRRKQEREADRFSVKLTEKPDNLVYALAKLADNNLSELDLTIFERLFKASHPGVKERIKAISNYC